jgi:phage/plasmid primase-like uncharacterized protein
MLTSREMAESLSLRRTGQVYSGKCPSCGYQTGFTLQEKDGRKLVYCHAGGCNQEELIKTLSEQGLWNSSFPSIAANVAKPAKPDDKTSWLAESLWLKSQNATNTLVQVYLKSRGIEIAVPDAIRFLPEARYEVGQVYPVMLSSVTDWMGNFKAVHRTFLAWEGAGKANVVAPKKSLGPIRGSSVHLTKPDRTIVVTEGIETGLSVLQAMSMPTWAALSTGGMVSLILPPLPLACEVIIAADPDPPGRKAALTAAEKWHKEGRKVTIASPTTLGMDFNELLKRK